MADSHDVQRAVGELSNAVGCPVLIEDPDHAPLWWSGQETVDEVGLRTILQRTVAPEARAMVSRLRLARATGPVRTPEVPEIGMKERWCVPLRVGRDHLGYLWVVDPRNVVRPDRLGLLQGCADLAAGVLANDQTTVADTDRRRAALVDRLAHERDAPAARELIELDRLRHDATVVARAPGGGTGWRIGQDVSVDVWTPGARSAESGTALPLLELGEAVRRARCVVRAVRAGARPDERTWQALGAWRMVVDAPVDLVPAEIHPGVALLRDRSKPDLLDTARAMLDNGDDVNAAASELHIHRTTLYYRLDRIKDVIGVDLRVGHERTELHLALWLDAYRRA
jgi:hypothetical protein